MSSQESQSPASGAANRRGGNERTDYFEDVQRVPLDIIFATDVAFKADPSPLKVNLGMGVFKDESGSSVVLNSVKTAEQHYLQKIVDGKDFKDYEPSAGFRPFVVEGLKLILGKALLPPSERIAGAVSLSGSGAIRLAAEFLFKYLPPEWTRDVLISDPTWPNHHGIFGNAGFRCKTYPYFSQKLRGIDFDAVCACLYAAERHSVIVLQLVGHNPTGQDFTREQWGVICDIVIQKRFIPIFDSAYQGFASGDLERDAFSARLFAQRGVQFIACQSFAKNMGMYGDRCGLITMTCKNAQVCEAVQSNLDAMIIRPMYSSPPRQPARVAYEVLTNPELRAQWEKEVKMMGDRIMAMRVELRKELERLGTPGSWVHITDQIGMFSYLGLTPEQCKRMCNEFHIYLLPTSRASMSGVRPSNVKRIADAIDKCVRGTGVTQVRPGLAEKGNVVQKSGGIPVILKSKI